MTPLTGAAAGAMLAVSLGPSPLLPFFLLAAVPGLLLALIDMRCLRLPDRLVAAVGLLTVVPLAVQWPPRIGPALVAGGVVLTTYGMIALLPGRGLGLGDVKLAAVLATVLGFAGWPAVIVGLVVPHLINGTIALTLLLARRGRPLPFGPALLFGALVALTTA
ncbi:prepilin peptidase [Actinoplanes sp. LDG1-06]|uniref:Prepilin peptidase n=2 Tax=Paractinoplanes ovalisporus TaxID=2810368 RepID=A0ABS2AAV2_9ACTN|nr:prepilin peptidase [Actinoplanes ovalisporus]